MLLAVKVTSAFDRLTRPERVNVLIQDDSVIKRNRSKKVELLARVYDHVEHKFQKGFTLLTLGWSDGYSFIPTGFNLLSSASENNRYNEISNSIDHRTNGYKFRKASMMRKTDAAVQLIRNALTAGKVELKNYYDEKHFVKDPDYIVRMDWLLLVIKEHEADEAMEQWKIWLKYFVTMGGSEWNEFWQDVNM